MSYWGPDLPRRLADHFTVIMFDNRGVGESTGQTDPSTARSTSRSRSSRWPTTPLG